MKAFLAIIVLLLFSINTFAQDYSINEFKPSLENGTHEKFLENAYLENQFISNDNIITNRNIIMLYESMIGLDTLKQIQLPICDFNKTVDKLGLSFSSNWVSEYLCIKKCKVDTFEYYFAYNSNTDNYIKLNSSYKKSKDTINASIKNNSIVFLSKTHLRDSLKILDYKINTDSIYTNPCGK